jgi:hypothetical protein
MCRWVHLQLHSLLLVSSARQLVRRSTLRKRHQLQQRLVVVWA